MNRITTLIIFFTLFMMAVFGGHYYIWRKLVKRTDFKNRLKKKLTILIIILAIIFPLSFIIAKIIPYRISFYFLWIGNLWLGMMILFLFAFIFTDLFCFIVKLPNVFKKKKQNFNSSRRKFIASSTAIGISSIVFGTTFFSIKKYYDLAVVKKIKIKIKKLPNSFKGFKIVQISDIHIGQIMRKDTLSKIVKQVNELKPNLIVITGDLADGTIGHLFDEVIPLKDLKAEKGIYFVTGNHEYYSGVEAWVKSIKSLGIIVLANKNIEIINKSDKFSLIGVNDHDAGRFGVKNAPDFKKAFSGINKNNVKILLAHQPKDMKKAIEYNVDLMLSGHTHGGQIWPFGYLVELNQKYLKGYYHDKDTQLYVNQGTGCWGPPMRLGTENEITEIELV